MKAVDIPELVELVQSGVLKPSSILTQMEPMSTAIEAYEAFDQRRAGWLKVELVPQVTHQEDVQSWRCAHERIRA
jgi:threonine dehydrogenase-like Zn-dependent dehydrogenase